jgi:hypothetical protein
VFTLILVLTARTYFALRRFSPTSILLDAIRTRRGLKWGVPAMLLAVPYGIAAAVCTRLIETGGPGWLNLLVLLFIWNALKFIVIGPISFVLLLVALVREARARRHAPRATSSHVSASAPFDQLTLSTR